MSHEGIHASVNDLLASLDAHVGGRVGVNFCYKAKEIERKRNKRSSMMATCQGTDDQPKR